MGVQNIALTLCVAMDSGNGIPAHKKIGRLITDAPPPDIELKNVAPAVANKTMKIVWMSMHQK